MQLTREKKNEERNEIGKNNKNTGLQNPPAKNLNRIKENLDLKTAAKHQRKRPAEKLEKG